MAEANSVCYTYGQSKLLIKQCLLKYQLQCQKAQYAIHEHMKEIPANIDMTTTTNMINNLIHKDQYQLRVELDRRQTLLQLGAEEHQLVDKFYKLNPRQTEINSAKIIWKAIQAKQAILHEIAIFQKRIPPHMPTSSCTLKGIQLPNINQILTSLVLYENTSSTEQMAKQTLTRAKEMAKHYENTAVTEKTKL
ncbi:unnamed protein product [Rotaria sp. Silwood2]|nr:unnamed protein product [Rotaria sp. Silwood2]CAF3006713.1 unnamed protein product [Rotaria sp. Silwood2]CAF3496611.1 unnamed protein product [Rotaria sp. Silwood2]CAF4198988.1 unnamed protein product [Rotaria sp. Silwood2]CAF4448773.1 unnamed protein product [Rotaria sp. Silwood2]